MQNSLPLLYEGSDSFIYYLKTSEFGAPVAVKVLKEVYPSPKQIARLTNEYELTRELSIDGIRKIYRQDKFDDKYALFMEYVDGTTLKSVFGQEQPEDRRKYVIDVLKIAFATAQTFQTL